jgi:hypothetical protein
MKIWSTLWASCSVVLNYLNVHDRPVPSDCIIGFGSDCIDVPHRVAQLFHDQFAPIIVFCGGRGRLSGNIDGTEAAWFRDVALGDGVPSGSVILEEKSSNAKENVLNAWTTLLSCGAAPTQVILVTQNMLQRRAWATWRKQVETVRAINCPPTRTFADRPCDEEQPIQKMRLCLGEIDRLREYGVKGDILPQKIPPEVMKAARALQQALGTRQVTGNRATRTTKSTERIKGGATNRPR